MRVVCLCLTYNRDKCLQRAIRFFINQDYSGVHTLFIFNSGKETSLPEIELPENKKIILVNRNTSISTGKQYSSVGEKYTDAINLIPECDIVSIYDNDDIYLPNHITEGAKGMEKSYGMGKLAYKPLYSYFKGPQYITKQNNVFEPSIFVDYSHIKSAGFLLNQVKFHDGWLLPLIADDKILADEKGVSTFCYDWSGEMRVYKMSGRADTNDNFISSQLTERDYGNGITTPISQEEAEKYYNQISNSSLQ